MRMTIFERSASDAVDVPAVRPPSHANPMRVCLAAVAGCVLILPACKSGPESKIVVKEHFSIAKAGKRAKQTWAGIEITDLGEPTAVARPVRVQSCRGRYLKFAERKVRGKKGKTRLVRRPIYEVVHPLEGLYVRGLKIRNGSPHVLSLGRVEAVLLDAAGNDNENMSKAKIGRMLRGARPCRSTRGVIASLRSLKILGSDIRLHPDRSARIFAVFSGVDKTILGDWTLRLHGISVETDRYGRGSRVAPFAFSLVARGYRTAVEMRRDSAFGRWKVVRKTTEPIKPDA